jgi:hypothetical protein
MPQKGSKKLIPVPEQIVRDLSQLAKRSGLTVQEVISLILSYAARSLRGREDVNTLFVEAALLSDARRFGGLMVPLSGLERLLSRAGEEELRLLQESYKSFISSLSVSARVREYGVAEPRDLLSILLPLVNVDEVEAGSGARRLIITSATPLDKTTARLIESIALEVLRSWGCSVSRSEAHESLIVVEYSCAESPEEG